jgi:hypothetical protein
VKVLHGCDDAVVAPNRAFLGDCAPDRSVDYLHVFERTSRMLMLRLRTGLFRFHGSDWSLTTVRVTRVT